MTVLTILFSVILIVTAEIVLVVPCLCNKCVVPDSHQNDHILILEAKEELSWKINCGLLIRFILIGRCIPDYLEGANVIMRIVKGRRIVYNLRLV